MWQTILIMFVVNYRQLWKLGASKATRQLLSSNPVFLLEDWEQKTISLQSVTIKVIDGKAQKD